MKTYVIAFALGSTIFGTQTFARVQSDSAAQIIAIAENSDCAKVKWGYGPNLPRSARRGLAPKAYIHGVALVFARAVCKPNRPEINAASAARGAPGTDAEKTDALTWYDMAFHEAGMTNDTDGPDTLRHAFTLLVALGIQESSGKYCSGRDRSANFSTADSAEAGTFQTSWGVSKKIPQLRLLFERYKADQNGCLLDVFREHVTCSDWDARTWGDGRGAEWQQLTKSCPAFAAEYALVVMRNSGGNRGEFGPIRKRRAQVLSVCDAMLVKVQTLVQTNPQLCASFQ